MPNNLRAILIVVVTIVWAINFTAPIFKSGFEPVPELNVAFMAVLGVLLAVGKKDDDDSSPTR